MQLVEIQPRELKFTFEVKRQSSCTVHLANLSDQYIAFKVKTTSPKRYCVRPNTGIIKPKSTCSITVIMQAQKSAPENMQCKDKFLIQSTVIPFGSTEEDITPGVFIKDSEKYFEECKLRVILTSPPHSPVLLPVNGIPKQGPPDDSSMRKEELLNGLENPPPPLMVGTKSEHVKKFPDMVDPRPVKVEENAESILAKRAEFLCSQQLSEEDTEGEQPKLYEDIKELNSKLRATHAELIKAEDTIAKLKEDYSSMIQEKETLKQELAILRRKDGVRRIQVGFPRLFVFTVALLSLALGFHLHG